MEDKGPAEKREGLEADIQIRSVASSLSGHHPSAGPTSKGPMSPPRCSVVEEYPVYPHPKGSLSRNVEKHKGSWVKVNQFLARCPHHSLLMSLSAYQKYKEITGNLILSTKWKLYQHRLGLSHGGHV